MQQPDFVRPVLFFLLASCPVVAFSLAESDLFKKTALKGARYRYRVYSTFCNVMLLNVQKKNQTRKSYIMHLMQTPSNKTAHSFYGIEVD